MLLRLRIALPDRPGSLGQVTRALGSAGADITQVIVLDRGDGRALDDFTVYWPDAAPREYLVHALESVEGVRIDGIWATREAPGTYPELEILKFLTTAGDRALATLIDSMPVLFSADWAAAATEKLPRSVVYSSWRAPADVPLPDDTPARPTAGTLPSGLHVITAPLPP
ncbi:amino acid-binding protein, partial [Planotetraspora sp. A-T 1434]